MYSYGVVLLELLTGRVPIDTKRPPGEHVLVSWVSKVYIIIAMEVIAHCFLYCCRVASCIKETARTTRPVQWYFIFTSQSEKKTVIFLFFFQALPRLTNREKVVEMVDPALEGQYSKKDLIQVKWGSNLFTKGS